MGTWLAQTWPITAFHPPGNSNGSNQGHSLGLIYRFWVQPALCLLGQYCSLPHGDSPTGVRRTEANRWKETVKQRQSAWRSPGGAELTVAIPEELVPQILPSIPRPAAGSPHSMRANTFFLCLSQSELGRCLSLATKGSWLVQSCFWNPAPADQATSESKGRWCPSRQQPSLRFRQVTPGHFLVGAWCWKGWHWKSTGMWTEVSYE